MGSDYEAEYYPQADYTETYENLMVDYKMLGEFVENITKSK